MGCCVTFERMVETNAHAVDQSHFRTIATLGRGGFGRVDAAVRLVDHTSQSQLRGRVTHRQGTGVALKRFDKRTLLKKDESLTTLHAEREVLVNLQSPFLLHAMRALLKCSSDSSVNCWHPCCVHELMLVSILRVPALATLV
jgi:hypothetical protein